MMATELEFYLFEQKMDVDFNKTLAEFSNQVFLNNLELNYNKKDLQHERIQNEQRK